MRPEPSELFIAAIMRGYDAETKHPVTCSAIWDRICMRAILIPGEFDRLFLWDTRKGKQNRIKTIQNCIRAGQVPGLWLEKDEHDREIVRET